MVAVDCDGAADDVLAGGHASFPDGHSARRLAVVEVAVGPVFESRIGIGPGCHDDCAVGLRAMVLPMECPASVAEWEDRRADGGVVVTARVVLSPSRLDRPPT